MAWVTSSTVSTRSEMNQRDFGNSWTTSLQKGGIVVSVIWQPARQVTLELGLAPYDVTSGYVIVCQHELSEPPAG